MLNKNVSQSIMVWFLPIIIIGGLFIPILGYIAFFMMITLLVLSYFKHRLWCAVFCPRGAFFDKGLAKLSTKKGIPRLVTEPTFKLSAFIAFMLYFIWQLIASERTFYAIGYVFVKMCLVTTIIAIFVGLIYHQRTWCMFCPMGFLQSKIFKLNIGGKELDK